jgi:signal transduction histidine kinase
LYDAETIASVRTRAVMEERERFVRDLHDGVTQEVIAASMQLAAIVPFSSGEIRDRLEEVLDRQEAILHNLRETVFSLKEGTHRRVDAVRAFSKTIDDSVCAIPYRPTVTIDGHVSEIQDPSFLGSAVFALREMISNVIRHAQATEMEVVIRRIGDDLDITVRDNGIGVDPLRRRGNGLDNLEARASGAGGSFTIDRVDGLDGGLTEARLRMPIPGVGL